MHCSTEFFPAYSGAVFSFILEKSTDYRQIAHDHACQIQLENQQPRYLARTINSGNFVHSCKYDFRKYWGSKRKRTNPMISRSRYLQPWSISKWAHDQILLHRKGWDSNVPTKSAGAFSQLQNLLIGTNTIERKSGHTVLIKNAGRIEVPVRGIGLRHTKTTSVPLCSGEFFLLLLICLYAAPFHLDRRKCGAATSPQFLIYFYFFNFKMFA